MEPAFSGGQWRCDKQGSKTCSNNGSTIKEIKQGEVIEHSGEGGRAEGKLLHMKSLGEASLAGDIKLRSD